MDTLSQLKELQERLERFEDGFVSDEFMDNLQRKGLIRARGIIVENENPLIESDELVSQEQYLKIKVQRFFGFCKIISGNKIYSQAHRLKDDDRVSFSSTKFLPTDLDNPGGYFVVNSGADDFQLSYSMGGSPISISDDGQGLYLWEKW